MKKVEELNIGQSIVARSVFTGLGEKQFDMKELIKMTIKKKIAISVWRFERYWNRNCLKCHEEISKNL